MSLPDERQFIRDEMTALNAMVREVDLRAKIVHAYLRDGSLNDEECEVVREVRLEEEFG